MSEMEDEDEYEYNDEQNPDITSALPWDLKHIPFEFKRLPVEETIQRSSEFYSLMSTRRTVRFFSSDPIPADVIRNIIRAAGMLFYSHMKLFRLQIS
jgi:iodotyrosine deiodinase